MDNALEITNKNEVAASAATAAAFGAIQAAFMMAKRYPRSEMGSRNKILDTCRRPGFAEKVIYSKPIGTKKIEDLSIKAAEVAINAWENIKVIQSIIYEDEEKRIVDISAIDLETNTSYATQATIKRVVERTYLKKNVTPLYTRLNSYGETTYGVKPTDDEFETKVSAMVSKHIRNNALRLIPEDIKQDMKDAAQKTMLDEAAKDPKELLKKICEQVHLIGVEPQDIETYLKHPISSCSPTELTELRKIHKSIKDGQQTWSDYSSKKTDDKGLTPDDLKSKAKKKPTIPPEKIMELEGRLTDQNVKKEFLKNFGIKKIDDLPADKWGNAMVFLTNWGA